MATLDVFKADAFSSMSLTAAINKLPYKPSLLGTLGIFSPKSVTTTVVAVEERQGKLSLIPQAARGTINKVGSQPNRVVRNFTVPHLPEFRTILADDIQNIRAFGSETELETMSTHVNDTLQSMKDNIDATMEWHRVGALKGVILDADGTTTIYNLFTEFGVSQNQIDFNYNDTNFSLTVINIIRTIADTLGGTPFGQIYAICGNTYFDAVKHHTSTQDAYKYADTNEFLRTLNLGPEWYSIGVNGMMLHNVMFINYRGAIGGTKFIADTEAYYFASGVPELFLMHFAPAPFMETVNTPGKPYYAKQRMLDYDLGVELHAHSNPLAMCTRPASVIKSEVCNFDGSGSGCP